MFGLLYRTYFKRVLGFAVFLQMVVTVSFAFFQAPHFLGIIKGIKFSGLTITFMILLRTVEWLNFITISSLIAALLMVIGTDVKKFYLRTLMVQMGRPLTFLIRPMLIISVVFAAFSIVIDGFFIPYGDLYLKTKLIEISKTQLVTSIQPRHIVNFKGWNFGVARRESDTNMTGVLLNRDIEPKMTIFIKQAKFENKEFMNLDLDRGVGKIELKNETLLFEFEKGHFAAPSSSVSARSTDRNKMLYELTNWQEFFRRTWMAIVGLTLPFVVFVVLFGSLPYVLTVCALFSVMLFMALQILPFFTIVFLLCGYGLFLIYRIFCRRELGY